MNLLCKICGGSLGKIPDSSVYECEFCGTRQTLPLFRREEILARLNHGTELRRMREFDAAVLEYEAVRQSDPKEPEAYWGLILCRYGVEYVTDPGTGKRIPTLIRMQQNSVLSDPDYLEAVRLSDTVQAEVRRGDAEQIDRVQQRFAAITAQEKPYDVFICYKESDENGKRTPDSVYAQEIYTALTRQGVKVFFSRITLESVLGQDYEPYIYAALHSAKVMLVICLQKDYILSPWVRNEWSRYLYLMGKESGRYLIPVYRDFSPRDFPQEFKTLQGQDYGKIGALQDLQANIGRILNRDLAMPAVPGRGSGKADNELRDRVADRAFIYLQDGDWDLAEVQADRVVKMDPEFAQGYLAKVLCACRIPTEKGLMWNRIPFYEDPNWQLVKKYAGEAEQERFRTYEESASLGSKFGQQYELLAADREMWPSDPFRYGFDLLRLSGYKDAHRAAVDLLRRGVPDADPSVLREAHDRLDEYRKLVSDEEYNELSIAMCRRTVNTSDDFKQALEFLKDCRRTEPVTKAENGCRLMAETLKRCTEERQERNDRMLEYWKGTPWIREMAEKIYENNKRAQELQGRLDIIKADYEQAKKAMFGKEKKMQECRTLYDSVDGQRRKAEKEISDTIHWRRDSMILSLKEKIWTDATTAIAARYADAGMYRHATLMLTTVRKNRNIILQMKERYPSLTDDLLKEYWQEALYRAEESPRGDREKYVEVFFDWIEDLETDESLGDLTTF